MEWIDQEIEVASGNGRRNLEDSIFIFYNKPIPDRLRRHGVWPGIPFRRKVLGCRLVYADVVGGEYGNHDIIVWDGCQSKAYSDFCHGKRSVGRRIDQFEAHRVPSRAFQCSSFTRQATGKFFPGEAI